MIELAGDGDPAGYFSGYFICAVDGQRIFGGGGLDAAFLKTLSHCCQAIRFFDAKFADAFKDAGALGAGCGDR